MILPNQNWDNFNSRLGREGGTNVDVTSASPAERGMFKAWFEPLGIFCDAKHGAKQKLVFACRHCRIAGTRRNPTWTGGS